MRPAVLQYLQPTLRAAGTFARAAAERANWIGIQARLATALLALLLLLWVSSNGLIDPTIASPPLAAAQPPAPATAAPAPERTQPDEALSVRAAAAVPPPHSLSSKPLLAALAGFRVAVMARVDSNTDDTRTQLDQSLGSLELATRTLLGHPSLRPSSVMRTLTSGIASYRARAPELIATADRRHAALADYAALVDSLTSRADQALSRTQGPIDRLFARPPLTQLRAELDDVARGPSIANAALGADDPTLTPVLASEQQALSSLETHQKSLQRSQGDAWYTSMQADLGRLPALRGALVLASAQLRAGRQDFTQGSSALAALVPDRIELTRAATTQRTPRPEVQPPARAVPAAPAAVPAPLSVARATVRWGSQALPAARSFLTAGWARQRVRIWITASASVLVLYLLIATAVGIILPVRRLIRATRQLANGEENVCAARGGIKELDRLVVAFNTMAAELALAKATARHHEGQFRATISAQTERLEELAKRDPLTGLDNRRELLLRLNAAIERALATDRVVGVLFLDIDNFKYINDSMGHLFGDRLLVSLAQRLQNTTHPFGHAGRLGGDEFMVILDRASGIEDIQAAGLAVVQAFQEPLSVDGQELSASVSVGASVYPYHARDATALLQAADAALFRAKALGRSKLSLYGTELAELGAARITTEQGLRRAIERGEFELVFQPELNAATLDVAVVEALIRWRTGDGTLLGPDQFLAVAEDTGLIVEISTWVMHAAIEAAARWHHGAWPEARVAINVSPRQLLDQRFVDRLQALLQEYRLPTRCIEIELTESVLQTGPATIDALKRLRAKGVAIALDDFGTGYSSFSSLEKLPLTRVKLDRSLIASIDVNPRSAAIARGIISMCQGLGLEITAEGVERAEQLALLMGHRLMYLQGYLFASPVAREELMPLMAKVAERAQALLANSQLLAASNVIELPAGAMRRVSEA